MVTQNARPASQYMDMRLLLLIALTFWLAGASARVGDDPYNRYRKEYGKGLTAETDEAVEEDDADTDEMEEDETEEDDGKKTKETSVHRKHFMDQYFLQSGPVQYEFGHVCEDPKDWEQRYEKRDFDQNRHQGQVKWGDAHGGQGEHYWDFNHDGNIEDELESDPWDKDRFSDESKGYDGRSGDGSKARGIIKEKLTITKKKNGRTVDQTKINMHKLADIGDIIQQHEPKPFSGDASLIEEFNRKTQGFKKNVDFDSLDNDDSEDSEAFPAFYDDIRRMGTVPARNKAMKINEALTNVKRQVSSKTQVHNKQLKKRHDVSPKPETEKKIVDTKEVPTNSGPRDLVSRATINIDTKGKANVDPITGSLTDSKTGRKFKIFGVLVDT